MILEEKLKNIIAKARLDGNSPLYIRTSVKEYLQSYVLGYIYSDSEYGNSLIFTGGTCLRKVYGINRLSEDLDFDSRGDFDSTKFSIDLKDHLIKKYLINNVSSTVKQQGRQVLLKFEILNKLGLASATESPMLYVKLDITKILSTNYKLESKLLTDHDFNYIVRYYDLGTLMAGKIMAVLFRNLLWGQANRQIIKGRDYFDLLWFLDRQVEPNFERIRELADNETDINISSIDELMQMVDDKVKLAVTKYKEDFSRDLLPFINNSAVLKDYVNIYPENYARSSAYLRNR